WARYGYREALSVVRKSGREDEAVARCLECILQCVRESCIDANRLRAEKDLSPRPLLVATEHGVTCAWISVEACLGQFLVLSKVGSDPAPESLGHAASSLASALIDPGPGCISRSAAEAAILLLHSLVRQAHPAGARLLARPRVSLATLEGLCALAEVLRPGHG
ncbi:MAG: hypothetical protein AB1758_35365, partial [Candidatus Eremiobacterota bacterium]